MRRRRSCRSSRVCASLSLTCCTACHRFTERTEIMKQTQTLKVSPYTGANDGTVDITTVVEITETNAQPFNWLIILKLLAAGAKLDPESSHSLTRRAGNWPTCACGELCKRLPRRNDDYSMSIGAPRDHTLYDLGLKFSGVVATEQWARALAIFRQIETRTAELL